MLSFFRVVFGSYFRENGVVARAYHKTKDIIHVQTALGHKNIEVTRQYINIEHSLYESNADDGFITKVATTQKEILELLDVGFDYIMQKDGLAYFRKRK